jgi:NDP-sugar pyrophosphorylase family protein
MQNLDVYESDDPWIDIGVPERLEWAREKWDE